MINVVILGFGNVGQHLYRAFSMAEEVEVSQVYNRSLVDHSFESTHFTSDISNINTADIYIICMSDDAISSFSKKLTLKDQLVVHTSGSVAMSAVSNHNRAGVFYPLQTFSKNQAVDFTTIPIGIEAAQVNDEQLLTQLGNCLSQNVFNLPSEKRKVLHLAAVFSNNFVNHLYHISKEILKDLNLDFDVLKPLIAETANKVKSISPENAQTGPAMRGDLKTMEKHLKLLNKKDHRKVYKTITKSISKSHGKKL